MLTRAVAVVSAAIFLTIGALYYLPAGLLIGNGWEAWRRTRTRTRAKTPDAGAGKRARAVSVAVDKRPQSKTAREQRVLIAERTDR